MGNPSIINGEEHFFPIIYEGNGAGQRVGKFVPFTDNGTIANSVIFNSPDDPKLGKTFSGAGTEETWTFSCWIKLGIDTSNGRRMIFSAGSAGSNFGGAEMSSTGDNSLEFYNYVSGSYAWRLQTNRTLEDRSKWYHLLFVSDTTNSTEADRARIYIDGERVTSFATASYPSLNYANNFWMGTTEHEIGTSIFTTQNFDGYMAEVNNIDGSVVLPSTFGLVDTSSGRWIPKTLSGITYGTNGFRLTFADSSAFGDDTSGNTNDFTATNLATTDQTTDSPTQNFATGTATASSGNLVPHTISEGNLTFNNPNGTSGRGFSTARSTLRLDPKSDTGYYCEVKVDTTAGGNGLGVGVTDVRVDGVQQSSSDGYFGAGNNFQLFQDSFYYREINGSGINATDASTFPAFTTGDTLGLAFKSGKLWIAKNNTWYNSGNPSTGANPLVELSNTTLYRFCLSLYGMNLSGAPKGTYNFGQKSLTYTAPTGFVSLQQDNMPETAKGISGFTWIKDRDNALNHNSYDSSNGVFNRLVPNANSAILNTQGGVSKFLKGGIVVGDTSNVNNSGASMVSWNWVANKGTTASNTDGSISSTVQANTTAGFSIVQYTGTGSAATVGHGLSKKIDWMIIKELGNSNGWIVSHKGLTSQATYSLNLSNTNAEYSDAGTYYWNNTAPTSSVFSIATDTAVNRSSGNYVAYCWHGVDGFSKFGKYVGNSNADGTFVYTGFKPSFVLIKSTSTQYWMIQDSARWRFNPTDKPLFPSSTDAESGLGAQNIDLLSNGFKCRGTGATQNSSSHTYIYMVFAEHPFLGDGTSPVTAR